MTTLGTPDAPDPSMLAPVGTVELDRLRAHLAEAADGLVDVGYRIIDTPIGPLLLAATDRGLLRLAFEREGFDTVLDDLAHRIGSRILRTPNRLDAAARQLTEYFDGARHDFELPLDPALSHGFRLEVQQALPTVTYGRTTTYKQLAAALGRPRAVRAVGTACATNPWPIVVPCHRVLRSDGGLGGYLGGITVKTALLEMERGAA